MTFEHAKQVLADQISQAKRYYERGDIAMYRQALRNIEDLPLPTKYVEAALKTAGVK